jgi:tryptophan synthase alpha chain
MSRIAATFAELKARGRMAFMPFVTCGDPDMPTTLALIRELAGRGVDLIEVGFPYSDPIADGPVIQASYTRALAKGLHVRDIFAGIRSLDPVGRIVNPSRDDEGQSATQGGTEGRTNNPSYGIPPLVAMVAYAIIFRHGPETFVREARDAGFSGLIVPDLPGDEAGDFADLVGSHGLDLVQLIAPTTPPARVERILSAASGFVYCISVAGTTGVRDDLPAELQDQLKWLRTKTDLPLAVGFGVSRPEQIAPLRGLADGVIVGSAIVRQLEAVSNDAADADEALRNIGEFASRMLQATFEHGVASG